MMQANESIDNLIKLIDDELIILSNAQSVGKYKWFDFKTVCRMLNNGLQNMGYNDYRKRKVSELINVFDDLCHTVVKSISYRTLSYDKERGVRRIEEAVYDSVKQNTTMSESENEVASYLNDYYEKMELPEPYFRKLIDTVKIDYILNDCQVDYSVFRQVYGDAPKMDIATQETSDYVNYHPYRINDTDEFYSYFDVDINYVGKHRISFEAYVKRLKAERLIDSTLTITNNSEDIPDSVHFYVRRSYTEMQRILIALQQGGFISSDTAIDTFYYRMTGHGPSTSQRIVWTKKSPQNGNINLASLVDLVVSMGEKVETTLKGIGDVFCREDGSNIKLPNQTKTNARKNTKSQFHQDIQDAIATKCDAM